LLACPKLAQWQICYVVHDNGLFVNYHDQPRLGFRWLIPDNVCDTLQQYIVHIVDQICGFLQRAYPTLTEAGNNRYAFTISRKWDDQFVDYDSNGQGHTRTDSALFILYIREGGRSVPL